MFVIKVLAFHVRCTGSFEYSWIAASKTTLLFIVEQKTSPEKHTDTKKLKYILLSYKMLPIYLGL